MGSGQEFRAARDGQEFAEEFATAGCRAVGPTAMGPSARRWGMQGRARGSPPHWLSCAGEGKRKGVEVGVKGKIIFFQLR